MDQISEPILANPNTEFHQSDRKSWSKWLFPTSPRRLGIHYLVTVTLVFLAGSIAAFIMRGELSVPSTTFVSTDTYNRLFTAHGILMIFFFLLPAIPGVLGNLVLPRLLHVQNLAFPKLNLIGWYCLLGGSLLMLLVFASGGIATGWTLSLNVSDLESQELFLTSIAVILASISLLCLAINQVVTVIHFRDRKVSWMKLPVFSWSLLIAGLIAILSIPILLICLFAIVFQTWFGWSLFDSSVAGDPMIQRRFFWFFGRPALYMLVLPAVGIITEILSSACGRIDRSKRLVIVSMIAIAIFGMFGAGSHLMVSSQSVAISLFSTFSNLATVIPFSLIVLNWIYYLAVGIKEPGTPLIYGLGCILLLVIGGLSGIVLATIGTNVQLHSTHFVLAHFHYLLAGCIVMAYLGGIHLWWTEVTGRNYISVFGNTAAVVLFTGINLTFFPMFILGFLGMLRRHPIYPDEFQTLNVLSTAGMTILLLGYLFPALHLFWTLKFSGNRSASGVNIKPTAQKA